MNDERYPMNSPCGDGRCGKWIGTGDKGEGLWGVPLAPWNTDKGSGFVGVFLLAGALEHRVKIFKPWRSKAPSIIGVVPGAPSKDITALAL